MLLQHFINGNVIGGNLRLQSLLNPAATALLGNWHCFSSRNIKEALLCIFTLNVVITLSFVARSASFSAKESMQNRLGIHT